MESLADFQTLEGRRVYTVFSITRHIRENIEADPLLNDIWVEGEISSFHHHTSSGHYYFTIKDENAQIKCAAFKNVASSILSLREMKDGSKVLVKGDITLYPPRGEYSLRVRDVRLLGKGDLFRLYEELKKKLETEGLFDHKHKKQIPQFPEVVGVVTSESGAAFQDIINVLGRRYPLARIMICPAKVQGEGAAQSIASSLKLLDGSSHADVIILGRGGGSMEDLWCFNEEAVARAIFACKTPVISAVGHETDFTIADFVADLRAPTPSAAAELVAPDIADLRAYVIDRNSRLEANLCGMLETFMDHAESLEHRLEANSPRTMVEQSHRRRDDLEDRLASSMLSNLKRRKEEMLSWAERLESASMQSVLRRGYSITLRGERIVESVAEITEGDEIAVLFSDGRVVAKIISKEKET